LELLSNDIATLKVAGCCLEQKVSELQIVNKFLLETASITARSLLQNNSEWQTSNKCLEQSVEETNVRIFEVVHELTKKKPPSAG
jgi:hypothetical protein